jgi:small subunit ribosomal protein S5
MAEFLDGSGGIESTTVGVFRTAATVKGGRRFSFSSLVVVGDRNGRVGAGYGKANQVPPAIEKAQKIAKRNMRPYPMQGRTIPHEVEGRFGACRVRLVPASPGTGVIAGASVRAVLEMFGLQDCLTKSYGSNNSKNVVKATIDGLSKLRGKDDVERLRGVQVGTTDVEEMIVRGTSFLPVVETTEEPAEEAAPSEDAPSEPAAAVAGQTPATAAAVDTPQASPAKEATEVAPVADDDTPKESPAE